MSKVNDIINSYAEKITGHLGVGYKNLQSGEEFYLNGDVRFPAASVFKVPVLIELFNQLQDGAFSMDDLIELSAESVSLGSGILGVFSPGIKFTLKDYATLMMIVSDNTATDYIVNLLGKDKINATIKSMGLKNTTVDYTCDELIRAGWNIPLDTPAEEAINALRSNGRVMNKAMFTFTDPSVANNWTSPWDITEMFSRIYHKKVISPKACDEMMDIMGKCATNNRIPYLLPTTGPDEVQKVIHKTGTLFKLANDAGIIISAKQTYILSIFYNGYNASPEERDNTPGVTFGERLLAELSKDVYNALHTKQ